MSCCYTFQEENKITAITKPPNLLFSIVQISVSGMIFQGRLISRYQKPETARELPGYCSGLVGTPELMSNSVVALVAGLANIRGSLSPGSQAMANQSQDMMSQHQGQGAISRDRGVLTVEGSGAWGERSRKSCLARSRGWAYDKYWRRGLG